MYTYLCTSVVTSLLSRSQHRILRMQQDVQLFLKSMPCRDTSIGMVEFSGDMEEAVINHALAPLDQQDNLQTLLDAIPAYTKDETCIGCGILRAIEVYLKTTCLQPL